MTWEDKTEMIRLLNNRELDKAVEMFTKETDWDDQALTMFIFGFPLTEYKVLEPIKDRLLSAKTNDFRTAMRLAYLEDMFNGKEFPK